jgi:SAM-dependent methyltransferase
VLAAGAAVLLCEAATCELDDTALAQVPPAAARARRPPPAPRRPRLRPHLATQDLANIRRAYDVPEILAAPYANADVLRYYKHTTDRDYQLLRLFEGPGLHSKLDLRHPIRAHCGLSLQPAYVLREAANAKSVLDVGCGRGFCTFYLANLMPDVAFTGIDLLPRHAEVAARDASKAGYNNVQFLTGDATCLHELGTKFDIIFAVEALCHLDTDQKMRDFLSSASSSLNPNGKIVIVDGFRSPGFDTCSPNQQLAMRLAETGFRIRRMPSKALWASLASESGFHVVRDVDLTQQVLPFWRLGWRFAHAALKFPPLIRYTRSVFVCITACACHHS